MARFDRARHFQKPDDIARKLAAAAAPRLAKDLRASLLHLRQIVPMAEVKRLLARGQYKSVAQAIDYDHFKEVLKHPFDRIGETFESAGQAGAARISKAFRQAGRTVRHGRFKPPARGYRIVQIQKAPISPDERFSFDRFAQSTQDRIRAQQDRLIRDLGDQAREAVSTAILSGVRAGADTDTIAAAIRDSITLTDRQAQAVFNFRMLIEDGDPAALDRALRNTEFDNVLQDIIDGGSVSDDVIDQMVADYADNYLDYRANTIAGTESMRASNMGLHDAYSQAIERGVFPDEAVRRTWQLDLDERTCPVCLSIPDLNPDGVGVSEPFDSEDGPVDDAPVHPNCRCSVDYETNLDMIPAEEEAAA